MPVMSGVLEFNVYYRMWKQKIWSLSRRGRRDAKTQRKTLKTLRLCVSAASAFTSTLFDKTTGFHAARFLTKYV